MRERGGGWEQGNSKVGESYSRAKFEICSGMVRGDLIIVYERVGKEDPEEAARRVT